MMNSSEDQSKNKPKHDEAEHDEAEQGETEQANALQEDSASGVAPSVTLQETLFDCPTISKTVAGLGGQIKQQPSDFIVEEIPLYEPAGEGNHIYLWIEKEDTAADDLAVHLAQTLKISRTDVGMAGLKDRQAITRQYISVPESCEGRISRIDTDNIRVLRTSRHRNKLKTGHLKGNRFTILVRSARVNDAQHLEALKTHVLENGIPNYFGAQRFGVGGRNVQLGIDLLSGAKKRNNLPPARRRFLVRMALSAVQSALFNQVLADRVKNNLMKTIQEGDVMQVVASGGLFLAESSEKESLDDLQTRFDARNIVPTGPLFGRKMKRALNEVLQTEIRILETSGLDESAFWIHKHLTSGARRPLLVYVDHLEITQKDEGVQLEFDLPSGCYATTLLREIMQ